MQHLIFKAVQTAFVLSLFLPALLSAQDPHFSQFFANRIYLNPAYAGFDPGTTLELNYRDQWFGIPDGGSGPFTGGFRTYNASANLQLPCFLDLEDANAGFAISVFSDETGMAPLRTTGAGMAFSHEQPILREGWKAGSATGLRRLDLRAGFQLAYAQRQFRSDRLIYSYQLDPVVGLLDGYASLDATSRFYNYLNAGVLIRGLIGRRRNAENLFTLGISFSNINEPDISFGPGSPEGRLSRRTTFYLGTTHRINRMRGTIGPLYFSPQFRWDRQLDGELNLQTVGANIFQRAYYLGAFLSYNFPRKPVTNTASPGLFTARQTTVLILNTGVDLRMLFDWRKPWRKRESGIVMGFAYDINLSGLDNSVTAGVLELNLRVNFQPRMPKNCAELGKFELYDGKCPTRF